MIFGKLFINVCKTVNYFLKNCVCCVRAARKLTAKSGLPATPGDGT